MQKLTGQVESVAKVVAGDGGDGPDGGGNPDDDVRMGVVATRKKHAHKEEMVPMMTQTAATKMSDSDDDSDQYHG